ncbi:MAG: hypothetical protein KatS3mg062_0899 [Tepidiforma sp.]|nr:MAG: hypothetical protein KatS3mg062_0899 [Tepidiforma sp.]
MTGVLVRCVPYGEARGALAEVIDRARQGDPLRAVTVVVPSNLVGLDVRRWLARQRALANVRFLVLERLAELAAAPLLQAQGKRPRTRWQWLEHLREEAAKRGGALGTLAGHPATLRRLAALAADLRGVPAEVRRRIADAGGLAGEALAIIAAAEERAAGLYDDHELVEAAAAAFAAGARSAAEAGYVVLYLPERVPEAAARLLRAAAGAGGACAVIGLTGDADADARAAEWCRLLGREAHAGGGTVRLPGRLAILPDPEEEVRFAIREVWRRAAEGMPLHRMAVLYGNAEQYAALVHERLEASETPHNGRGLRRLADSLAGRAVLGALRAARLGWRRDAVIDWVTSAPLSGGGGVVRGHAWDVLSREAGVVRGLEQWKRAPDVIEAALREQAAEGRVDDDDVQRRTAEARRMAEFVADAARRFEPGQRLTAAGWGKQALDALEAWLPMGALGHAGGGIDADAELAARGEVVRALDGLASLDAAHDLGLEAFETLLREVLDVPAARHGKLGEGVFTGTIEEAAGMTFDFAVMVGFAERVFPPQPSNDPLLPERVRQELGGAVPSAEERVIAARRAYLAVVAGSGECIATAPRVSLRDQRPAQPSKWFLEAAARLHGGPVYARDIERWVTEGTERPGWLVTEDSFAAWVERGDVFGDRTERDLAEVVRSRVPPWEHPLMRDLGAADGIGARAARSRVSRKPEPAEIGPWTGEAKPAGAQLPELSASALETLTSCPFRYFLGYELRLREAEKPEELDTIDPAARGSLVHEVLEQFVKEVKQRRGADAIEGRWSEEERQLLFELADRAFEAYERAGRTGRAGSWGATRERLRQDFARFLDADEQWRLERGAAIRDAELAFGSAAGREATAQLAGGRRVAFLGKADRVDLLPDGGLVVIDYKTGKKDRFIPGEPGGIRKKEGGWLLQLPIYALAARGDTSARVTAAYWFISEEGGFERVEVTLDEAQEQRFREVVTAALELREQGLFPAVPGKPDRESWKHCSFCPYDRVCPGADRDRLWERWSGDTRLAGFIRVAAAEQSEAAGEEHDDHQ